MEYAIRHPDRVSQLLLLDTGPASAGDWRRLRESFAERRPAEDQAEMARDRRNRRVPRGDLEAEAAYYRIHFRMTLRRPDLLEALVARLRCQLHGGRRPPRAGDRAPAVRGDIRLAGVGSLSRATSARRPDSGAARRARLRPRRAGRADRRGGSGSAPFGAARAAATSPTSRRRSWSSRRSPASAASRPTSSTRTRAASPSPRRARARASPASSARSRGRARPGSGAGPARGRRGRAGARRAPARRRRGP